MGIQNLSTDYNTTITMKRVVPLPLEMTKREDVANYTQESIFQVETVRHSSL